ncbi:MAG: prepilin peptidase [candidate division Zixibacteria bacterium]
MNIVYASVVVIAGLSVGSFLNVLIFRMPRNKPFAMERSICPHCSEKLRWYHNIPLVSYLLLGGKCSFCKAKISLRYPLVEAANALLYLYFFWQLGLQPSFFIYAYLSSALLTIFFIDLDFQIIPDLLTLPGIAIGLAVSLLPDGIGIVQSAIGFLVGGGSLYLMAVLGEWLFKKEAMGGGDIKMCAMLGAFLGWQKVLFVFLAAAGIGLIVSIIMMVISAKLRETRMIPFGPFLATAAMVAILYGDKLIALYIDNFINIR